MKPPETILLIIRRSLGDVLAVSPVVDILARRFASASIDLLVNQDTAAAANLLKGIRNIIAFDDGALKTTPVSSFMMQIGLLQKIFRRYDLAMAFTTNERSNLYAFFAGRTSIGAREKVFAKNWWHRLLLDGGYLIDPQRHILENNLSALSTLGISIDRIVLSATYAGASGQKVQQMLKDFGMDRFIIFHPSGRYRCKSYPEQQRNSLLRLLDSLNIPIIVTGGHSDIDRQVAATLPELKNVRSFIGRLSLEECAALTDLALAYVGVDTFNAHLAAAFNKPVFVMFGPTIPEIWSPWSNDLQTAGRRNASMQIYGNITLFQSGMACVPCGHSKCRETDRPSPCMEAIDPRNVFHQVQQWFLNLSPESQDNAKNVLPV